jgi:hypothetical protein
MPRRPRIVFTSPAPDSNRRRTEKARVRKGKEGAWPMKRTLRTGTAGSRLPQLETQKQHPRKEQNVSKQGNGSRPIGNRRGPRRQEVERRAVGRRGKDARGGEHLLQILANTAKPAIPRRRQRGEGAGKWFGHGHASTLATRSARVNRRRRAGERVVRRELPPIGCLNYESRGWFLRKLRAGGKPLRC